MLNWKQNCLILVITISIVSLTFARDVAKSQGETTSNYINFFPADLNCTGLTSSGQGPTWHTIIIGVSKYFDLIQQLSELSDEGFSLYTIGNNLLFASKNDGSTTIPAAVRACVQDDIVMALGLDLRSSNESPTFSQLITQYGIPDAVTWTLKPTTRVAFWFEKGVAAEVLSIEEDRSFGRVLTVVYFPFQDKDMYEAFWPYNATNMVGQNDENYPTEQNPFDYDALMATAETPNK
jgi:hypothetical protein